MRSTMAGATDVRTRRPIQLAATAVAATFLLVGILGFIPGVTQNFDAITGAGPDSEAKLLGIFEVNILHNIVHAMFGIIGLVAARTLAGARNFLVWGGAIYLALWIYGMAIDLDSTANIVSLNTADNWLHFSLGAAMLGLGIFLPRAAERR
jgi:hypothetical protein